MGPHLPLLQLDTSGHVWIVAGGTAMARYYYMTSEEPKADYHDNQNCDEGKKIEANNRVDTDTIPAGRELCEVC
jgi:hypothetical protein